MGSITYEMTQKAYGLSKEVYRGKIDKNIALDYLENQLNMNRGSAQDYVNGFRIMMEGGTYKRTFNNEATDYYLNQILRDFGIPALENALKAVFNHLQYYESLGRGHLKGIRKTYNNHLKLLKETQGNIYPDEIEKNTTLVEGTKKKNNSKCI